MIRSAFLLLAAFALAAPAFAQPVNLAEKVAPGDCAKCSLELDLKGNLFFVQDGKQEPSRLEAKAKHVFAERVLAVAEGLPSVTARHYYEAGASAVVGGDKSDRALPADRRLIVARRDAGGLFCFASAGPLTRDELDLVTDHFNPQCLAGLLPGKAVNIGDTWTVNEDTTLAACLLDSLIKAQLTGKLTAVKDGIATFTIEGSVEGIESGAKVTLVIDAAGTFDVTAGRITELLWKQKDARGQGPINPASQVEATVLLKREPLAASPKEIPDDLMAKLEKTPLSIADLKHIEPKGRYTILHSRDWHVTGQTDSHLVLRLVDKGEFVAQATVSIWRKAAAGQHGSVDDFKKAVADAPGWTPAKVLSEGEVPAGAGRWMYRLTVEGKMDSLPVVQTFYLLAGPQGDQVVVTVAMKPEKVQAVANRDAVLVNAIEFGTK